MIEYDLQISFIRYEWLYRDVSIEIRNTKKRIKQIYKLAIFIVAIRCGEHGIARACN